MCANCRVQITALDGDYQPRGGGPTNVHDALKRVQTTVETLLDKTGHVIVEAEEKKTLSTVSIDHLEKARNEVYDAGKC